MWLCPTPTSLLSLEWARLVPAPHVCLLIWRVSPSPENAGVGRAGPHLCEPIHTWLWVQDGPEEVTSMYPLAA